MAEVLVTGGTGLLGGRVVGALVRRGHSVRILSRRARDPGGSEGSEGARLLRGDLASGLGLREAVAGAEAIVHCASATGARTPWSLRKVDVEGTRRLVRAARETGADAHLVYPSIVGVDAVPLSYYHAKRAAEEEVARSGLAWTIGRSTQFHALVLSSFASSTVGRCCPCRVGFVSSRSTSPRWRSGSRERSKPGPVDVSTTSAGRRS